MAGLNVLFMAASLAGTAILATAQSSPDATARAASPFRLSIDDVIQVRVLDADEISDKALKVGSDGFISLTTVGRLQAAGLTVEEVQAEIVDNLKRFFVNPDVTVSVVETHKDSISVIGAVKNPGVIQLSGRKTLVEVMSLAGGPTDDAGYTAIVMRRKENGPLPLPNASSDPGGEFSVAEVNVQSMMQAHDAGSNILMMPNDVISVPKAEMVYVIGDVVKPGSIAMGGQKGVTVLQAIAITSGLGKTAKATQTKILR